MRNQIEVDFADNPPMADLFSGKQPGDKCKLIVEFQINEMNAQGAKGTVLEVEKAEYETERSDGEPAKDHESVKPSASEPIMMLIAPMKMKAMNPMRAKAMQYASDAA